MKPILSSIIIILSFACLAHALKTRNVIIMVIDGARYTETFGDSTHRYIPNIWNNLKPQGTIFTRFFNNAGQNLTETCPGHSHILTGTWQNLPNDGSLRPTAPTIFEYFRKQTGSPDSSCYVILGKNKLTMLTYSAATGYGADFGARFIMPQEIDQYSDTASWTNVKKVLQKSHPRMAIINMPQVDYIGHNGSWDSYVSSIQYADSLALELWNSIQTDSIYKNKTSLIIVNDHGRHTTDFTSHGDMCMGCRHILCMILGPDAKVNEIDSAEHQQIDIAPTTGLLLGFNTPQATGSLLPLDTIIVPEERPKQNPRHGMQGIISDPLRTTATFSYSVAVQGLVSLKILNVSGKTVAALVEKQLDTGNYSCTWNTTTISPGTYVWKYYSGDVKEHGTIQIGNHQQYKTKK